MRPKILVVEDDTAIRELIHMFLEKSGFQSFTAISAEAALDILKNQEIGIVLTDVQLPGINGLELTKIIKQNYNSEVIIMTGYYLDYSIEEAMALQRLATEFKLTHEQAADSVGRSRAAVTNLLRLLTLNPNVRELLEDGTLDMGHGRALLALEGNTQSQAAREVVKKGLSVRETEQLVRRLLDKKPAKKKKTGGVDADTRALQEKLSDKLGAKVRLQHSAKGSGKLIIEYNSSDELEGILAHLR